MFRKLTDKEIKEALAPFECCESEEIFASLQKSPSASLCMLFSPLRKNAFEFLPVHKFHKVLIIDACLCVYNDVFKESDSLYIVEKNEDIRELIKKDSRNRVYESVNEVEIDVSFDFIIYLGCERGEASSAFLHLKDEGTLLSTVLLDKQNKFQCLYLQPNAVYPISVASYKTEGSLVYVYGMSDNIPLYVKYSDERADYRNIKTEIIIENSKKYVFKKSMSNTPGYMDELLNNNRKLANKLENVTGFIIVPGTATDNGIMYPYIEGRNLSDILHKCLYEDKGNFKRYLKKYHELITYNKEAEFTDLDLIFSNIIVDEKGIWNIIDCEWCVDRDVDDTHVMFRALYNFSLENNIPDEMLDEYYRLYGIDDDLKKAYIYDEAVFQKRVTNAKFTTDELLMWAKTGVCPVSGDMMLDIQTEINGVIDKGNNVNPGITNKIKFKIQDFLVKRCIRKYETEKNRGRDNESIAVVVKENVIDIPDKSLMNRGMHIKIDKYSVKGHNLSVKGEMYVPNQNNSRYIFGFILSNDEKRGLKIEIPLMFASEDIDGALYSARRIIDTDIFLPQSIEGEYYIYGFAFDRCSRQKIYRKTENKIIL